MQKIDSVGLRHIPQLRTALSPIFRLHLLKVWKGIKIGTTSTDLSLCNFYESFHFALGNENYAGTDILNSPDLLIAQYLDLLKYLKDYFYFSEDHYACVTWGFFQAFKRISLGSFSANNSLFEIKSRLIAINESLVLVHLRSIEFNEENIRIMCQRSVTTSLGQRKNLNLSRFEMHYGEGFTNLLFEKIKDYAQRTITTTFTSEFNNFSNHSAIWMEIEPNLSGLEQALKANNVSVFFESCLLLGFAKSQADGNDPKVFFKSWGAFVNFYIKVLSNKSDLFQKSTKEIICPKFKGSKRSPSFNKNKGVQATALRKWIINIPLYLQDSEAVDLLASRVKSDINYLSSFLKQEFEAIKNRFEITESTYTPESIETLYRVILSKESWRDAQQNYSQLSYTQMQIAYSIPTLGTMQYLTAILVMEHPSITPSWLFEWKLYDRNGNLDGYKQVGKQWVVESLKRRKGVSKSQQVITLNQYTKMIVELIIKLTTIVRGHLKAHQDELHRYMLLYCDRSSINSFSTFGFTQKILNLIHEPSKLQDTSKRITKDDAIELASLVSFRSLRRSMALYDYFENRSVSSASEILGHTKVSWGLITSYIPQSLIDFFNARWVRQFQNAIVFEAMKDSPYLFEAIDIKPENLKAFLKNHGLKDLPTMTAPELNSESASNNREVESIEQIVFTVSTGLLQVFIAIRDFVDGLSKEEKLIDLAYSWYESAVYVLKTIELEEQSEEQLIKMYNMAVANPIDLDSLSEALLWEA